jgi:Rrf2 family nitric oxide-sensitive transcriptional repressor
MRLTTYTDYSLRLLIYLAVQGGGLATIPEVAESYGISRHHMVKVAHQLGVKGYIETTRGKRGGLRLAKPAREIVVGDVVRSMEPDLGLVPCLQREGPSCRITSSCRLRTAMQEAQRAFLAALDEYTLADLVAKKKPLRELLQIMDGMGRPLSRKA